MQLGNMQITCHDGRTASLHPLSREDLREPLFGGGHADLSAGSPIDERWVLVEIEGWAVVGWCADGYLFLPRDEQSGMLYYRHQGPVPQWVEREKGAAWLDAAERREYASQWYDIMTGQIATWRSSAPLAVTGRGIIPAGPLIKSNYRPSYFRSKRGES